MNKNKIKILESKGYKIGSAEDFLSLSREESAYINLKFTLSQAMSEYRKKNKMTQVQLAEMLNSSQSRIAKMEKGDPTVSIGLLTKSLLAMSADKS